MEIYCRVPPHGRDVRVSYWLPSYYPTNQTDMGCLNPVMSTNGERIVFLVGQARFDGWGDLQRFTGPFSLFYNVVTNDLPTTFLVATNLPNQISPSLSGDGRWLAYEDGTNVYVWDAETATTTLVNINLTGTGPGNAPAYDAVLSPDGSKVVFISAATDLCAAATGGSGQVFLRDLTAQTTQLITVQPDGTVSAADNGAAMLAFCADAKKVAFTSRADDLVADDLNRATDVFVRDVAAGLTTLISERTATRPQQTGIAATRADEHGLSSDGRYVAFASDDSLLVPGDTNGWSDVFVQDLSTGAIAPLSTDASGMFESDSAASQAVLSSNGQYAVFARRPGPDFVDSSNHVFWVDRASGLRHPVDVDTNGIMTGSIDVFALSPNGQYVAFQSSLPAETFVPGITDDNTGSDVFLRDMMAGTNQALNISRWRTTPYTAHSSSSFEGFSPDGRWLLFASGDSEEVTNHLYGEVSLFARDLPTGRTCLVTLFPWSMSSQRYTGNATWSGDSRYVAYVAWSTAYQCDHAESIFVYDFETVTNRAVAVACQAPSLSFDGRWLACEKLKCYAPWATNILLMDLQTGWTNMIATSLLPTNDPSADWRFASPWVSPEGRFVAFLGAHYVTQHSFTNYPAAGATTSLRRWAQDLYLYDRLRNRTLLLSANLSGEIGNSRSQRPLFSADGKTLVFQSSASDLVAGDYNDHADLFVLHLGSMDTDGDGLDDDWEMAYFDNLDHDGTADSDHDGQTDAEEFRAGTDPTNGDSVLQVLTITSPGSDHMTILWYAVPGRAYRVQYKNSVTDPEWTDLPGIVTATSTTGSATDLTAGAEAHRYYRVLLAP